MILSNLPEISSLPPAVKDLALRLGADPDQSQPHVWLHQTGRIRPLGSKRWMAFTATQSISTLQCRFDWRARAGPFGFISVCDAVGESGGQLDVLALGFIPLVRTPHTTALERGELMRYLAELAWAPDAILHNRQLRWREEGADRLAVGAGSGETAVEVILSLDDQGRIAGVFAPDRPRSAVPPYLPTPWSGRFSDYRHVNGRWIPFAGEVSWEIEGKQICYYQGRIEKWETGTFDHSSPP